jgi:hypothetical protein
LAGEVPAEWPLYTLPIVLTLARAGDEVLVANEPRTVLSLLAGEPECNLERLGASVQGEVPSSKPTSSNDTSEVVLVLTALWLLSVRACFEGEPLELARALMLVTVVAVGVEVFVGDDAEEEEGEVEDLALGMVRDAGRVEAAGFLAPGQPADPEPASMRDDAGGDGDGDGGVIARAAGASRSIISDMVVGVVERRLKHDTTAKKGGEISCATGNVRLRPRA